MGAGGWGREEAGIGWREKLGCGVVTTKPSASPWEVLELGSGAQAFVTSASSHCMCVVSGKGCNLGQSKVALFLQGQFPKRDDSCGQHPQTLRKRVIDF